jgi:hypothetical protein
MKIGKYKHYKGKMYELIGTGINTETEEEVAIYKSLYSTDKYPNGSIWVRPLAMFQDKIKVGGEVIPRFKYTE